MTIQREYRDGPFVVQCNTCLDTEELDGDELLDAAKDAKARGFKPQKINGQWEHACSIC